MTATTSTPLQPWSRRPDRFSLRVEHPHLHTLRLSVTARCLLVWISQVDSSTCKVACYRSLTVSLFVSVEGRPPSAVFGDWDHKSSRQGRHGCEPTRVPLAFGLVKSSENQPHCVSTPNRLSPARFPGIDAIRQLRSQAAFPFIARQAPLALSSEFRRTSRKTDETRRHSYPNGRRSVQCFLPNLKISNSAGSPMLFPAHVVTAPISTADYRMPPSFRTK